MTISVSLAAGRKAIRYLMTTVLCFGFAAYAESPGVGMTQRTALRILDQATWGPTAADADNLQKIGFDAWFDNQAKAAYSPIPSQPLLNATTGKTNTNVGPLQLNFFVNAQGEGDQLRQRVAFALSEIWVVSNLDLNDASAFPPILRIFQKRAFGNYRDLMQDVTLSPAMGHYLDMANNNKGNPAANTAANENYARELMQLFTLGLYELHMDGSPVLDSAGEATPMYTQSTVTNLAKMFTGWTYAPVTGATDHLNNPRNFLVPMEAHEQEHDTTIKTIFGVDVPAGTTALEDVNKALDTIFSRPTIAPFISKQLIQHLVTSNPSPEYISRVSAAFENNGDGVRGDLKTVIYKILTDPEARAGDTEAFTSAPSFGHFREPVLFMANLLRGLNGQLSATSNIQEYAGQMGQKLFYPPSVFSYFAPGYEMNGMLAPEMQLFSTQTAVARNSIVNSAVFSGKLYTNATFDLTPYITAETKSDTQFFELVNALFFHNAMSVQMQKAMQLAMNAATLPADKAKAGLYIALTSSEYQVVH